MKAEDLPDRFPIPFADQAGGSFVRDIPEASQIGLSDGAASLVTGFPPLTFLQVGAGGTGPDGRDLNGLFRQISAWCRWQAAGGPVQYNSAYSAEIGGYPAGAIVASPDQLTRFWYSLSDDNVTDPDSNTSAAWVLLGRVNPLAPLVLYVNQDTGNNLNNGLTPETAFQTIEAAYFVLQAQYDLATRTAQIVVADSASDYPYATFFGEIPGQGFNRISLVGNVVTPGNCKSLGLRITGGARVSVAGFKFQSSSSNQISVEIDSEVAVVGKCDFGATLAGQMNTETGRIYLSANYDVSGGALSHLSAGSKGLVRLAGSVAVTVSGAPAFTTFALASDQSLMLLQSPFSGAATGKKYDVSGLSLINAGGAVLPGDVAGTTGTGGLYV